MSIRTGYFPSALKPGEQTHVHENGPNIVKNFRPITVCNNFNILEKVVRDRLLKRQRHYTIHATIYLLEATLTMN